MTTVTELMQSAQSGLDGASALASESLKSIDASLRLAKMDAAIQARMVAGSMGFSRSNFITDKGILTANETYAFGLVDAVAPILQALESNQTTALDFAVSQDTIAQKLALERQVKLVELEGERERGLAELEIERNIETTKMLAERDVAITTLGYRKQVSQIQLEGKKVVEVFKTQQAVLTKKAVTSVNVQQKLLVSQIRLSAKAQELAIEFGFKTQAKRLESEARIYSMLAVADGRMQSALKITEARIQASTFKGEASVDSKNVVNEAQLTALTITNNARIAAANSNIEARNKASQDTSTARILAAANNTQARITAAAMGASVKVSLARYGAETDIYVANTRKIVNAARIAASGIALQGRYEAAVIENNSSLQAIAIGSEARFTAIDIGVASQRIALSIKSDAVREGLNISNEGSLLALDIVQAARITEATITADSKMYLAQERAKLAIRVGDIKFSAEQLGLNALAADRREALGIRYSKDSAIYEAKIAYSEVMLAAELASSLNLLDAKTRSKQGIYTAESNAAITAAGNETDARIDAAILGFNARKNSLQTLREALFSLDLGTQTVRLSTERDVVGAQLRASAIKFASEAYARGLEIAGTEYSQTMRLALQVQEANIQAVAEANIKTSELVSRVAIDKGHKQLEVDVTMQQQSSWSFEKTFKLG